MLPCLLAWGVLRTSQVQVSSEGMEEGTGCLSQGSPQPGQGHLSLYREGWKPQICRQATFQFLELLNPFQPQGLCTLLFPLSGMLFLVLHGWALLIR